ncbi:MAG: hypothetical protein U0835_27235 [Isosphaeraceae bacterium]
MPKESPYAPSTHGMIYATAGVAAVGALFPPFLGLTLVILAGFATAVLCIPVFQAICWLSGTREAPARGDEGVWDHQLDF